MERRSRLPLRTWIVRITIASFSVAALMGVTALVTGNEFGETENKILLTTLLVGVASVAVLCCLATADTPVQLVGVAGGATTTITVGLALFVIWASFDTEPPLFIGKALGVGAVVSATLAQSSLLLTIGPHRTRPVLRLLAGTLPLAALLAGLVSALVIGLDPSGGYLRLLGVVAILDVLGTVVVAALAKFGGRGPRVEPGTMTVPADLAERLVSLAEATGGSPEALLRATLEDALHVAAAGRG